MTKNKFVCPECGERSELSKVTIEEVVELKNDIFKNTHHYMKCANCGEVFEDPNNIDQNYASDYEMYRTRNHLIAPKEITEIREKYELSQRQFAKILGISHSTLSRIESGALQSDYQNALFVLSDSPISFRNLIQMKQDTLDEKEYSKLNELLKKLVDEEIAAVKYELK